MRILVVDDDKAILGLLELVLAGYGHEVSTCNNAETALDTT